jgi:hypothetical protein
VRSLTRSRSPAGPRSRRRPLSPTGGASASSPTSRRPQPGLGAAARLRLGYDLLGVARTPRRFPGPFKVAAATLEPHPKP